MSEEYDTRNECRVAQDDSDGNPNLCCCYILEPEGGYSDPCYVPVGGCCINHGGGLDDCIRWKDCKEPPMREK